jgi:hypothetical protein
MNGRPLWERMMIGQWHERSTEKRRKFYWPRGLGGKRPKGQAADGIIRRGFRRAESAFLRTFAARTKGRAIIVLSGPSCNWPIGQRNLWKQQSTEANIFFFSFEKKNCSIQRRQKQENPPSVSEQQMWRTSKVDGAFFCSIFWLRLISVAALSALVG